MPPPAGKTKRLKQRHPKTLPTVPPADNVSNVGVAFAANIHALPFELQQVILNVFEVAFPIAQDSEELGEVIQAIKGHLFNRDFASAFSQPAYLQVYALRWSAARALSYSHVLTHPNRAFLLSSTHTMSATTNDKRTDLQNSKFTDTTTSTSQPPTFTETGTRKVVCLGGGAGAEIVAFAAAQRHVQAQIPLRIISVDSADWSDPVMRLSSALSTAPALSAHASAAAKYRIDNRPLLEDASKVTISFLHQDVLTWDLESMKQTMQDTSLCTIMFTLNELFSTSLPKTTSFLLNLTIAMSKGSHLLVVDSPGSYSEINLGNAVQGRTNTGEQTTVPTKKYPMKWLLDHTLLEVAGSGEHASWQKIESEDSLWFRIDQKERAKLKYPVELENMRYQLHLYQRT